MVGTGLALTDNTAIVRYAKRNIPTETILLKASLAGQRAALLWHLGERGGRGFGSCQAAVKRLRAVNNTELGIIKSSHFFIAPCWVVINSKGPLKPIASFLIEVTATQEATCPCSCKSLG